MTQRDYIIDIPGFESATGRLGGGSAAPEPHAGKVQARPWLAIYWKCCQAYSRIYRNRGGDAYEGRCPRCGKAVRARIGHDGTSARFFTAE